MFHDIEEAEAVEVSGIEFVARFEIDDEVLIIDGCENGSIAIGGVWVIAEGPLMDSGAAGEFVGGGTGSLLVLVGGELGCACAPFAGGIFGVGIEYIAAAVDSESDGVGGAPFIE